MNKSAFLPVLLGATISLSTMAQTTRTTTTTTTTTTNNSGGERYGKTLNLGVGIGYYRYAYNNVPVFHLNYEFDVAKNFTLAPFISFYTYQHDYYWGNKNYSYGYYRYRETVIPIGLKGTYYFDKILNAGSKWDFYLGASLGFVIRTATWEAGYGGDRNVVNSPLYLSLNVGTEYHINNKVGLQLDLSNGLSTVGIAIH